MGHYKESEVTPGSFGYVLCVNRLYAKFNAILQRSETKFYKG